MSQVNQAVDANAILLQLQGMLARQAVPPVPGAAPLAPLFGQPAAPAAIPAPTGVHIPLKIPVGNGSVKVTISFGPEFADPNNLHNLLNALGQAGYPVDVWAPKQNGNWGGGGGGGWPRR